jgi:hypothetical protein
LFRSIKKLFHNIFISIVSKRFNHCSTKCIHERFNGVKIYLLSYCWKEFLLEKFKALFPFETLMSLRIHFEKWASRWG